MEEPLDVSSQKIARVPLDSSDDGTIQKEVQQFIKLAKSFTVSQRQAAGSTVLEVLRNVSNSPEDVARVLQQLAHLAIDFEVDVRMNALLYIPHISMFLKDLEETWHEDSWDLITTHLLPIVVTALRDTDFKVVKVADSCILTLLLELPIPSDYLRDSVWPAIVYGLRNGYGGNVPSDAPPSTDAAIRIISMMSKMVPHVDCDLTEQLFIPMFTELCSHPEFVVRQACASIIGDFCAVLWNHIVIHILIPKLVVLSEDSAWGVRRAIAESLLPAAVAVDAETRKGVLTRVCTSLLADKHKAVQSAAFTVLGPFIATFSPGAAVLEHNHHGELVVRHGAKFIFKLNNSRTGSLMDNVENVTSSLTISSSSFSTMSSSSIDYRNTAAGSSDEVKEEDKFNSSTYWRDPIPDIDLDPQLLDPPNSEETSDIPSSKSSLLNHDCTEVTGAKPTELGEDYSEALSRISLIKEIIKNHQKVRVPLNLINWFTSMSHVTVLGSEDKSQTTLAHHCAYNLPAVAMTLGGDQWALLKDTYEQLAAYKQWKVRRIVASSIHELANIVGEEVATRDLVPVFNGFIKDLDEVRIGALKHLADFVKVLLPAGREAFLPRLSDFLLTDDDWNWRFRAELAEQLLRLFVLDLFTPSSVADHIAPLCFSLLQDRAAHVRQLAQLLMAEIMAAVNGDAMYVRRLVCQLAEQFAHSSRWARRQTFAQLCAHLVRRKSVPHDLFARDILPHLLDLSWDKVPNVRLAVARTLSHCILSFEFFANAQSPHHEVLQINLKRLQADKDRDVRALAMPVAPSILPTHFQYSEPQLFRFHRKLLQPSLSRDRFPQKFNSDENETQEEEEKDWTINPGKKEMLALLNEFRSCMTSDLKPPHFT